MSLTLNEFLFLVITIAAVVGITVLVIFLLQLRKTAREGEKTLAEIRELVHNLKDTNQKIKDKIDDLGVVVEASKKTAASVSEIAWFTASKLIRPASKYWPLVFPLLRFGWRQLKKRKKQKEEKNGEQ